MSRAAVRPPLSPSGPSRPASGVWLVAYAAAVVYATLHPWSGWRSPGTWMFAFLLEPWPRWWTGFDVAVNVAAYVPVGILLAAWLARRLSLPMLPAAALAALGAMAMSIGLESLQALLPGRVPSRLDVLANTAGGAAGAAAAAFVGRRRIEHWPQRLRDALSMAPHPASGLLLLCAWLVAQIYPQPMVFATGDLLTAWPGAPGSLPPAWLSPLLLPHEFEPFAEAAGVALTVLAVGLLAHDLIRPRAAGIAPVVAVPIVVAIAIKTGASAAWLGTANAFGWMNAGAQGGLLAGAVALLLLGGARRRTRLQLAIAAIVVATLLFNLAPPNAYYLSMRATWNGGAWINFHGLLRALAVVWPFAAIAWCAWRLRDAPRTPRL